MSTWWDVLASPLGPVVLTATDGALTSVQIGAEQPSEPARRDAHALAVPRQELEEYFAGERTRFTLALNPAGTAFRRQVWEALRAVPYGTTASYRDIAERIGNPKAVRAVGLANGANPIPIVIPCHRVIGADGSLTGYSGGLDRKRWLLRHEASHALLPLGTGR